MFRQTWDRRANPLGLDERVAVLEGPEGGRVEVWLAQGMNAYRWRATDGTELLFASPEYFAEARPSRSGHPVLFPFPNRIREGRFAWEGRAYELERNDPANQNAIHGFPLRLPWRLLDAGADGEGAWVVGEFQASVDAPAALDRWPGDYHLLLHYTLRRDELEVECIATNPNSQALPAGLGYHPYFALAPFGGEEALVQVPADEVWELHESLPTGRRLPAAGERDLRTAQPLAGRKFDDALTSLTSQTSGLAHPSGHAKLEMTAGPDFGHLVVFTPPHRQALCLEPYTCVTDAINLHARQVPTGLKILDPGESWVTEVAYRYTATREG